MACLLKKGMDSARKSTTLDPRSGFAIVLGGITCTFKREIKPYERFEIWTRVLSWDRKWLYLVSHVVKKDKVGSKASTFQPWIKSKESKATEETGQLELSSATKDDEAKQDSSSSTQSARSPHPAIFASSIARYVFKQGRLTIPPAKILYESNLLLHNPEDIAERATESPPVDSTSVDIDVASAVRSIPVFGAEETIDGSLLPLDPHENWDHTSIEKERIRGMTVAENLANLDELHHEFTAEDRPVLGRYWDIPW